MAPTNVVRVKNALLPGLGGPMGRHARAAGGWFNPLPWTIGVATAMYLVLALRQVPCIQTDATDAVNAFIRLCYSDIPLMYTGQGFGLGKSPLGGESMMFPPVLAVFLLATVRIALALGADIRPDADVQVQLDGAQLFFAVNMVGLFVFFLAWVVATSLTGRGSGDGRVRTWDGMLVAASPVVLAAGLINWELLPIGFAALGLWQVARNRLLEAGILIGLAAASGTMALAVGLAVLVALLLGGRHRAALAFATAAGATLAIVHIPLLLRNPGQVVEFYKAQVSGERSYGSVWFLLQALGVEVRGAGSLGFIVLLLALALIFATLYVRRLRPGVGTLVGITVFLTAMTGAAYSPQTALWLLFALVAARPLRGELIAFSVVQVGYYLAIWGWLSGHLTAAKNGPEALYFLAIGLRLAVDAWLVALFLGDAFRAAGDPATGPGGYLLSDTK